MRAARKIILSPRLLWHRGAQKFKLLICVSRTGPGAPSCLTTGFPSRRHGQKHNGAKLPASLPGVRALLLPNLLCRGVHRRPRFSRPESDARNRFPACTPLQTQSPANTSSGQSTQPTQFLYVSSSSLLQLLILTRHELRPQLGRPHFPTRPLFPTAYSLNLFAFANSFRNSAVLRFSRIFCSLCSRASRLAASGSVFVIATSRHML